MVIKCPQHLPCRILWISRGKREAASFGVDYASNGESIGSDSDSRARAFPEYSVGYHSWNLSAGCQPISIEFSNFCCSG